jgi:hypothetical protein
MQVTIAFVVFQFRLQLGFVGYLTILIPSALNIVASDVPQLRCGEPTLVEVATNLTVVRDSCDVGSGCLQHRTVFITSYGIEGIKGYV